MTDSYCGLDCSACELRESAHCGGCVATQGHPFHGACEIAACAVERRREFCGECADFPCERLKAFAFDPTHGDNGRRIERCKALKTEKVRAARDGVDPVSVCGHHCDYCFMAEWCGGCRSDYSCCSFATLFDDGQCPNVSCAAARGLDGCCDCADLPKCAKGYYGQRGEYVAKATALFVHRHGKAAYTRALASAVADGLNYPKSFDGEGSVEAALALLERYRDDADA